MRDSAKVGQLAKSDRQLCHPTKLTDKVAQLCCVSDVGLMLRLKDARDVFEDNMVEAKAKAKAKARGL